MIIKQLLLRQSAFRIKQQFIKRLISTQRVGQDSAKVQNKPNEYGHMNCERYWSRDPRFAPQIRGDTPTRFLIERLRHNYEVYPFIFLAASIITGALCIGWWSFRKVEINPNKGKQSMSWQNLRNDYFKRNTVLFDWDGRTHRRLEIMEKLQDEMMEASEKRNKRKQKKQI